MYKTHGWQFMIFHTSLIHPSIPNPRGLQSAKKKLLSKTQKALLFSDGSTD